MINKHLGRILLLTAFIFSVSQVTALSQVVVKKTAEGGNPTLYFKGIAGNQTLSKYVKSNLFRCGWFNLVAGGKAAFIVSGKDMGSSVAITVQGQPPVSFSLNKGATEKQTANQVVDVILRRLFRISGICSSKIAFCLEWKKGYKEIMTCDFDGTNMKQITKNKTLSVEPEWSPSCDSIFYTMYNSGDTDIVQYFTKSRRSRRVIQYPGLCAGAAVSPNGNVLAMILSKGKQVDLYIKNIESRGIRQLTKSKIPEASPCWAPNGQKICFAAGYRGNPKLYIVGVNGGKVSQIPIIGVEAVTPDWNKKNQIVYSARMGRNYTIGLTDLSGGKVALQGGGGFGSHGGKTGPRCLVKIAGDWENPSWAPDNRHIVCSRTLGGKSSLYIIDTWTGKMRKLLSGKYNYSMPSWSGIMK